MGCITGGASGEKVRVSGVVVSIDWGFSNALVVRLNSGDTVLPLEMAMLPFEEKKLYRLVAHENVFRLTAV